MTDTKALKEEARNYRYISESGTTIGEFILTAPGDLITRLADALEKAEERADWNYEALVTGRKLGEKLKQELTTKDQQIARLRERIHEAVDECQRRYAEKEARLAELENYRKQGWEMVKADWPKRMFNGEPTSSIDDRSAIAALYEKTVTQDQQIAAYREALERLRDGLNRPGWPHEYEKDTHKTPCRGCTQLAAIQATLDRFTEGDA